MTSGVTFATKGEHFYYTLYMFLECNRYCISLKWILKDANPVGISLRTKHHREGEEEEEEGRGWGEEREWGKRKTLYRYVVWSYVESTVQDVLFLSDKHTRLSESPSATVLFLERVPSLIFKSQPFSEFGKKSWCCRMTNIMLFKKNFFFGGFLIALMI